MVKFISKLPNYVKAEKVINALSLPKDYNFSKILKLNSEYLYESEPYKIKLGAKSIKADKTQLKLTQEGVDKMLSIHRKCNIDNINSFMTTSVNPLSVLYLFIILNDSIHDVPDDCFLIKYGYTCNILRRMKEHKKTYGNGIMLKYHTYIDPEYLQDAEIDVRNFFKESGWHLKHTNFDELCVVPRDFLHTSVLSEYKRINEKYLHKMQLMSAKLEITKCIASEKEKSIQLAMHIINNGSGSKSLQNV